MPLFKPGALAVVHPDVLSAGGIMETKIEIYWDHGVQMSAAWQGVHCLPYCCPCRRRDSEFRVP